MLLFKFIQQVQRAERPEDKLTLFSLYLRSMAKVVHERPGVNRFVAGGRLWQRRGRWVTFR